MNINPEIVKDGGVIPDGPTREETVRAHVMKCRETGDQYRGQFKPKWDDIQKQVAQVHPSEWDKKAAWQTKVYIGLQSKKSETAAAYLHKMIFGNRRFYGIEGVEESDKDEQENVCEYIDNSLERGKFYYQNGFVLQEGVDIGTSFIKAVLNKDGTGLDFYWRSAYNITFDPDCGNDFYAKKYLIDEYKKSISELIDDAKSGKGMYSWANIEPMLKKMQDETLDTNKTTQAMLNVKGINNTNYIIPKEYATVSIIEFWGLVPKESEIDDGTGQKRTVTEYEDRLIAIANDKYTLRDDANPWGLIPYFFMPVKQRLYDAYGKGFCFNSMDIQTLMNSMVNLGFDSLKMCSMDIAMINAEKVKDPASIRYEPMAVWKFKDNPNQCVSLTRQGISALRDILQGVTMLDQFDQETSGVLRQVQGAPQLSGGNETLGEYQAKLAMIDNRFLYIARQIERAYVEPLIRGVFKMLFNPKVFTQETVNRVLGMRTEKVVNPMTKEMLEVRKPKLDFNKIAAAGDMGYDFKATGMTQYTSKMENTARLEKILMAVLQSPDLKMLTKVDELWKKALQASELPDYQDILKSDDELQAAMGIVGGSLEPAGAGMPPQGAGMMEGAIPMNGADPQQMAGGSLPPMPPEVMAALASQGAGQPQGGM